MRRLMRPTVPLGALVLTRGLVVSNVLQAAPAYALA
jgi:hypothetical protein